MGRFLPARVSRFNLSSFRCPVCLHVLAIHQTRPLLDMLVLYAISFIAPQKFLQYLSFQCDRIEKSSASQMFLLRKKNINLACDSSRFDTKDLSMN